MTVSLPTTHLKAKSTNFTLGTRAQTVLGTKNIHIRSHKLRGSSCTACALRAYCARRGWDTHPSNTVGGDRIISSESISEK